MILEVKGIGFSYGEAKVLRNVSLSLREGEVTAILGPNGAGKSTLINVMGGGLAPKTGSVLLDGKPLDSYSSKERARRIAAVAQETHIPFPFTAFEVVLMGRAPYLPHLGFERRTDIETALHAMNAMDCEHLSGRPIGTLSGGERRRVIVARALAQQTPVILLDEPTNFLDIKHATELAGLLRDHARSRRKAVCAVMHDINLASAFSDRIVLIKDGAIVASGTPKQVITSEIIDLVFATRATVGHDRLSGSPYCIPMANSRRGGTGSKRRLSLRLLVVKISLISKVS